MNISSFFRSGKDTYSSKRIVGVVGMFIVHLCYAYKCIVFGDSSDTVILVTADTALLGVETVTNAISNKKGIDHDTDNEGASDKGSAECGA